MPTRDVSVPRKHGAHKRVRVHSTRVQTSTDARTHIHRRLRHVQTLLDSPTRTRSVSKQKWTWTQTRQTNTDVQIVPAGTRLSTPPARPLTRELMRAHREEATITHQPTHTHNTHTADWHLV